MEKNLLAFIRGEVKHIGRGSATLCKSQYFFFL